MSRSRTLMSEIARLEGKNAGLSKDLAKAQQNASTASSLAQKKQRQAALSKSESTRRSVLSSAEREIKKAADVQKKIAQIHRKIADNSKIIARKKSSLQALEASDRRKQDLEAERRRKREENFSSSVQKIADQFIGKHPGLRISEDIRASLEQIAQSGHQWTSEGMEEHSWEELGQRVERTLEQANELPQPERSEVAESTVSLAAALREMRGELSGIREDLIKSNKKGTAWAVTSVCLGFLSLVLGVIAFF